MMDIKCDVLREDLDAKGKFSSFVLEFISFLRKINFHIAPSAIIDFFKIIPRYDIFDYEEILLTMRSLFAKSPEEYHQFDALLKKYLFHGYQPKKKTLLNKRKKTKK